MGAWGLAFAVVIVLLLVDRVWVRRQLQKRLQSVYARWGKRPDVSQYDDLTWLTIPEYWQECPEACRVDQTTWRDLDMDRVFERINATLTSPGEAILYQRLHQPEGEYLSTEEQEAWIARFLRDEPFRKDMQAILFRLSKKRDMRMGAYLFRENTCFLTHKRRYYLCSLLPAACLLCCFFQPLMVIPAILCFGLNVFLYYRISYLLQHEMDHIGYMANMILCAKRFARHEDEQIKAYTKAFAPALQLFGNFERIVVWLFNPKAKIGGLEFVIELLQILFLTNVSGYLWIHRMLQKHQDELAFLHRRIGELDCCLSIAHYRQSLDEWCCPEFHEERRLVAEQLVHPLIEHGVPNSLTWDEPILLTGSNASGKSTWIRTLAINAILAQTIHTCTAKRFCLPRCTVMTSIAIADDLLNGDSYFIAEIKSLKRIIEQLQKPGMTVCFIDEILRGTNTGERIAASQAVLGWIGRHPCLCMAATHDLELTKLVPFRNAHFSEQVVDGEVRFDYQLKPGASDTKNAILLLSVMGIHPEIVAEAKRLAGETEMGSERFFEELK